MRIGLALPHYDFSFPDGAPVTVARVVEYARRAEDLGFDSVWISDHLFLDLARYGGPPGRSRTPEAMTLLAAVAAATSRIRLGSLVLCAPFRNTVVLAEQARALWELSEGRFTLGIGAGWNEPEFVEAGIPFGTPGERLAHLARAAGTLRDRLKDGPPLLIGGKGGPKVARIIASHADAWNVVWQMTPERYAELLATLDRACADAGRARDAIALSVGLATLVGTDPGDLARRYERLRAWTPGGALDEVALEDWARDRLVGTPETCAGRVRAFEALGVGEVVVGAAGIPFSVHDDEQLDLIARHLIPMVR